MAAEKVSLAASSNFVENSSIRSLSGDVASPPISIPLIKENLDYGVATNPSKLTHKLVASTGYTLWKEQRNTVVLGWGTSYTFASNRTAFEGVGFFGKLAVSF